MKTIKAIPKTVGVLMLITALFYSVSGFSQEEPRVIEIKGLNNMTYSKEEIVVSPGELITIRLTNVTDYKPRQMSHNWVLLKQTVNVQAFVDASEKSAVNNFIDPDREDQVIAHTDMASRGQTVEVTFRAPTRPSKYMYLCTFPGHFFAGMYGTLTVKPE